MDSRSIRILFIISVLMLGLMAPNVLASQLDATEQTITFAFVAAAQEDQRLTVAETVAEEDRPSASPAQSNMEQQKSDTEEQKIVRYSPEAVLLVTLILALLISLFWLLLSWSRKREMAGYYGDVYRETVQNWEYRRLISPYKESWERGEYHEKVTLENSRPEPPPDLKVLADELNLGYLLRPSSRTRPPGLPDIVWERPKYESYSEGVAVESSPFKEEMC